MDRLAWDLGDPSAITDGSNNFFSPADSNFTDILGFGDGLITGSSGTNPNNAQNTLLGFGGNEATFDKFHPMKGPMTTQTLIDIIGKEPHHWRGDKDGIEEFAGAFDGLQGDDEPLNATKMQEFEDFLSSLHFGPNPYRLLDNSIAGGPSMDDVCCSDPLDMTGFFTAVVPADPGSHSATGTPLETVTTGGDAWSGFNKYVDTSTDSVFRCVDCHTLPMGAGPTQYMSVVNIPFSGFLEIPPGPNGEAHQMIVSIDGTGQPHIKIPQTRNQLDKEGFFLDQLGNVNGPAKSRAGFGVLHDGTIDGLMRFLSENAFNFSTDQAMADIVAFALSINGNDFDALKVLTSAADDIALAGSIPPAAEDQTAHAGVGSMVMIDATPAGSSLEEIQILRALKEANRGAIGLVAFGRKNGEFRHWAYVSGTGTGAVMQSDRVGETDTVSDLFGYSDVSGATITFMIVPLPTQERVGLDRDADTVYDGDELTYSTDPANDRDHIWVRDGWGGTQTGSAVTPYEDMNTALSALSPTPGYASALHFNGGGTYTPSTSTFNTPMTFFAESGTATISLAP
jgi:hypothetical protein